MKLLLTPTISIAIITFQQFFSTGLSIDSSTVLTTNTSQTLGASNYGGESLSYSINLETIIANSDNMFDPKIHNSRYVEKIELLRNVTAFKRSNMIISEQDITDQRRRIQSNDEVVEEEESKGGGGLRSRNLQKVCKGTKKNIVFDADGWYTELKNSKGHFAFKLANYALRFKMENTNCGSISKAQEGWAYIHFEVLKCPVTINNIVVSGLVNQQNEVTDYLNIFIDGKHVSQHSAYPKWEDDLKNGVDSAVCSMGKPKKQMAYEAMTLQPGKHDFAVQIATNAARISHQGAFYEVKFVVL